MPKLFPLFRPGAKEDEAYTLTLGDRAENERGMEIIGKCASAGLSVQKLHDIDEGLNQSVSKSPPRSRIIDLGQLLPGVNTPPAAVLISTVNTAMNKDDSSDLIYKELRRMPKDSTIAKEGMLQQKHARHNNTIADYSQLPDILNGKGTVCDFADYEHTGRLRDAIIQLTGASSLVGEVNHYFAPRQCGIRYHGDEERVIVVGARFGYGANGFPLRFQWYRYGQPVGREGILELQEGDLYMMSQEAVGTLTFAKPREYTLRHAAGHDSYLEKNDSHMNKKRKAEESPVMLHPSVGALFPCE